MAVGDGRTDDHSEASSIQTTSSVNLSGGNGGGDRALSTNPAYVAGYVGGGQPNGVTGPSSQGFFLVSLVAIHYADEPRTEKCRFTGWSVQRQRSISAAW